MAKPQRSGYHNEFGSWFGSLASRASLHVRRKMFRKFEASFPDPMSVLDVGVTSEGVAAEANFFEEMFPHKERITAVGIEDAGYLESTYPGLKFVRVQEGKKLPFGDGEFEVAFSNAVIEHVVEDGNRSAFLEEVLRVSRNVFVTTPNRYFPFETHTGIPLLHVLLPALFYWLLDTGYVSKFYSSKNLRLMTRSEIVSLAQKLGIPYELQYVRLCGFISNWILIVRR